MIFGILLVLSLILINLESIPIFKEYSLYLNIIGIALFSSILIYISFNPKNYIMGILTVILITVLTAFEKSGKYSNHKYLFLTLEIIVAIIGFSSNLIFK